MTPDKQYKCGDCGESRDKNGDCYCDIAQDLAIEALGYVHRAHKRLQDEGLPLPETEIFIAGALYMKMKMLQDPNENT